MIHRWMDRKQPAALGDFPRHRLGQVDYGLRGMHKVATVGLQQNTRCDQSFDIHKRINWNAIFDRIWWYQPTLVAY